MFSLVSQVVRSQKFTRLRDLFSLLVLRFELRRDWGETREKEKSERKTLILL